MNTASQSQPTVSPHLPSSQPTRSAFPVLTALIFGVTALVTGSQFLFPTVLATLRRDPAALASGEWWRLLSPLLVDPDGWLAIAVVAVGILVVGSLSERLFGRIRWLALYAAGALAGEIAGYAWDPHDAGSSIAVCGLLGGLLAAILSWQSLEPVLRANRALGLLTLLYLLAFVGALVGSATGNIVAALLLGAVPASGMLWLVRLHTSTRLTANLVGAAGMVGALVLTGLGDLHGPALLAGACVGWLMGWIPSMRHPQDEFVGTH